MAPLHGELSPASVLVHHSRACTAPTSNDACRRAQTARHVKQTQPIKVCRSVVAGDTPVPSRGHSSSLDAGEILERGRGATNGPQGSRIYASLRDTQRTRVLRPPALQQSHAVAFCRMPHLSLKMGVIVTGREGYHTSAL